MENRPWEIYALVDPRTDLIRYVGVTFRGKRRFNEHMSRALKGGKTHRDCWIRSLIFVGLRPIYQVLETGMGAGWQDAEIRLIASHRTTSDLCNHTDGGDGTPGLSPSEKCRKAVSLAHKGIPYPPGRIGAMTGKNHTPEAVEKIRLAGTGRVMPEGAKRKISEARKGKPLSSEHKLKLANAKRGKKLTEDRKRKLSEAVIRVQILCVETGEVFPSITAAANALGVNEASVYQAARKGCRCKGNHYKRL